MSPSDRADQDAAHERSAPELSAYAFGEPVDAEVAGHVERCPDCRQELAAYRALLTLARGGASGTDASLRRAPESVWSAIVDELHTDTDGTAGASAAGPTPLRPRTVPSGNGSRSTQRRGRERRGGAGARVTRLVVAAAVVLGAGAAGWAIGRGSGSDSPRHTATAALTAQPGTSAAAAGQAVMRPSVDGYRMDLSTQGLPAPSGYYEVWLDDPDTGHMVAIGTLGVGGRGSFTVPAGIDTDAYHVVDVSDQHYDGSAAHETSVLRGRLASP